MKDTAILNSANRFPRLMLFGIALMTMAIVVGGCEIRPKPFVHLVEYQSTASCPAGPADCTWEKLERAAEFSALVNCLLAGANVLEITEDDRLNDDSLRLVVAPFPPRYGYEHSRAADQTSTCATDQTPCFVASRHDRESTWARCGTRQVAAEEFRGGEDFELAESLARSDVQTGRLIQAVDDFSPPEGLDGPDHIYSFTLKQPTRIEAAVAANRARWSGVVGLVQSAWQPALYLLSSDRTQLQRGYVLRAGVTALFPTVLDPGTYYLVVDSSTHEWKRGDGIYRLYLGFNQNMLGQTVEEVSLREQRQISKHGFWGDPK